MTPGETTSVGCIPNLQVKALNIKNIPESQQFYQQITTKQIKNRIYKYSLVKKCITLYIEIDIFLWKLGKKHKIDGLAAGLRYFSLSSQAPGPGCKASGTGPLTGTMGPPNTGPSELRAPMRLYCLPIFKTLAVTMEYFSIPKEDAQTNLGAHVWSIM